MRHLLWIFFLAGCTFLAFWIVVGPWFPKNPLVVFLIFLFFIVPNVGTVWMLYLSIRHENHPLPFVLGAFIPYAFLWYYFERVRRGKHKTRESLGATRNA